jgi:hypothetical protein
MSTNPILQQSTLVSPSDKIKVSGEASMRHHQFIEAAAFDPTTLLVIETAFESAWSEIEHHFGDTDADLARSRLAEALLLIAEQQPNQRDIGELKTETLQVLVLAYRCRGPLNWH